MGKCRLLQRGSCDIPSDPLSDDQLVHAHPEQVLHGKQIIHGGDCRAVLPPVDGLEGTAEQVGHLLHGVSAGKAGVLDGSSGSHLVDPIVVCVCIQSVHLRFCLFPKTGNYVPYGNENKHNRMLTSDFPLHFYYTRRRAKVNESGR